LKMKYPKSRRKFGFALIFLFYGILLVGCNYQGADAYKPYTQTIYYKSSASSSTDKSFARSLSQPFYAYIKYNQANLHSGPGLDESIIGTIWKISPLKITKESDYWYQVKTNQGKTGWVAKAWIGETEKLDQYTSQNERIQQDQSEMTIQPKVHQKRLALIIGNSEYRSAPLKNPVNDAKDVANNLELCGFEVIKQINASQRNMEQAVDEFYKKLKNVDVGFFYYAGHGIQVEGRNYLIPVDARVTSESDVKYESVDVGRILGKMKDAGNDLNIVMLDACRDNPFQRSFRSNNQGFAKMDAPRGSIIIYATAPGSIAADGEGRNGLYTGYFLDNMMKKGLPIEKVLKETRKQVFNKTNGKQIPWDSSSLMGDFYFNPDKQLSEQPRSSMGERTEQTSVSLASIDPAVEEPKILARDGQYVKYKNGVVYDKSSGLEWVAGPDKKTDWNEARRWVSNLNTDGGDWRMPSRNELRALYRKGAGSRNMTPLLASSGWYVWIEGKKAWDFYENFRSMYSNLRNNTESARAFAVRSRK
jgi:hypothetical protein